MAEQHNKPVSPKAYALGDASQRGSTILDYLDRLTPSKGGKYYCPCCGGNDLSIATTGKKAGALTCFNSGCTWQQIMDVIAPLDRQNGSTLSKSKVRPIRFKSKSEKDHAAIEAEILIDARVVELVWEIESGATTIAAAQLSLASWCKEHGYKSFEAGQLFKEKIKSLKQATGFDADEAAPTLLTDFRKIERQFGHRLRYNQLFKQVELDGFMFDPAMGKIELVVDHGIKLKSSREDIGDCLVKIAKGRSYHPVQEYLEGVSREFGDSTDALKGFAHRIFGASDPIHQTTVCKFLVSAVARAYEPGCQVDTALILQGAQGVGKSNFFRVIASPAWFDDSFGNASDKDERLKLHAAWILEWAELETVFRRKDVAAVKAFMTTKIDRIRMPYGRSVESLPRSSVFCGTTNEDDFLSDSTGNRRFWVVPVQQEIDVETVEAERDRIWAAAVSLYKSGVPWWLSSDEESAMSQHRNQYESIDPWHELIEDWVDGREDVVVSDLLTHCLGIETNQQDKRSQMRVTSILKRLNWLKKPERGYRAGVRVRIWVPSKGFTP